MAPQPDPGPEQLLVTAVVRHSPDLVLVLGPAGPGGGAAPEAVPGPAGPGGGAAPEAVPGVVRYANPAATTMLGRSPVDVVGLPVTALVHPDDRATLAEVLSPTTSGAGAGGVSHLRFSHVDGRWLKAEVATADLRHDPDVGGVVLYARDLLARPVEDDELRHLSLHDPLTGLANRALFSQRVSDVLDRDHGMVAPPHAVLIVDLDGFKIVNDSLGHAAGDEVLVEVAERLCARVRPGDIAARLGGDEFGVLLENGSAEDAEEVSGRILDALSGPVSVHDKELVVTASVGIAVSEPDQRAPDLIRNADVAMFSAKAAGKNRHQMFRREMQEAAARRLQLEADLRRAIEGLELVLHYQPIVDLASADVVDLEVLVRWQRPGCGLVLPGEFIAVAEDSGLIRPMGRWILAEACRQEAVWRGRLSRSSSLGMAVNVSPVQLDDPALVDEVVAALELSGTAPADLTLEITESVFMRDFDAKVERLRRLRDLGVKVAIDDFGMGWSSFSRLKDMPVDILKIDKTFVDGVSGGAEDSAVAHAIVKLAHTLGLRTVAEGIERREQAERLADMNCDMGQGFLFARPVVADGVDSLLDRSLGAARMGPPPGMS